MTDSVPSDCDPADPGPADSGPGDSASCDSDSIAAEPTVPEAAEPTIHLDQFLKTCGVATGGQAKLMIQGGEILLNGEVETRRRKQLRVGDEVTLGDDIFVVALNDDSSDD